jgi:hypothetical protein
MMSGAEIAALITAFGISVAAIITASAALTNARNSKQIVDQLRREIVKLKEHNIHQDKLLVDREVELSRLRHENEVLKEKIRLWHEWGQMIGRAMNEMQLMIGALTSHEQADDTTGTTPLPAMPDPPD